MTDGTGSGIVSAGATGLGVVQTLELIPPQLLGIILSLLGIVSMVTIIIINLLKVRNHMLENKILQIKIDEKENKDSGK